MEKDFFEFEANKRLTLRNSQEKQANKAKETQSNKAKEAQFTQKINLTDLETSEEEETYHFQNTIDATFEEIVHFCENNDSNTIVNSFMCRYKITTLRICDLLSVIRSKWINDNIIGSMCSLIQRTTVNTRIGVIDPQVVKLIGQNNKRIPKINLQKFEKIFFSINMNNTYWILCVIDLNHDTEHIRFKFLDLLANACTEKKFQEEKQLESFLYYHMNNNIPSCSYQMEFVTGYSTIKQEDNYNCGPILLQNMLLELEQEPEHNLSLFRKNIVLSLINGTLVEITIPKRMKMTRPITMNHQRITMMTPLPLKMKEETIKTIKIQ